jgi:hypothetical protein
MCFVLDPRGLWIPLFGNESLNTSDILYITPSCWLSARLQPWTVIQLVPYGCSYSACNCWLLMMPMCHVWVSAHVTKSTVICLVSNRSWVVLSRQTHRYNTYNSMKSFFFVLICCTIGIPPCFHDLNLSGTGFNIDVDTPCSWRVTALVIDVDDSSGTSIRPSCLLFRLALLGAAAGCHAEDRIVPR